MSMLPSQVIIGYARPLPSINPFPLIGKALARKRYSVLCKEVLKNPVLSGIMVREVANVVRLEGEVICSKRQKSLLGNKELLVPKHIEKFSCRILLIGEGPMLRAPEPLADSKWRQLE